jgi:hypothetical protein
MPTPAVVFCLLFLTSFCIAQEQKDEPKFPTNEEIQLVVTQAERAFDQYKASVVSEAELPTAKQDKSSMEKDQEVVRLSAKLLDALKKKPEAFNGLGGLLVLTTLDDASRNAALCANAGMLDIAKNILDKPDVNAANRMLAIVGKCTDVSSHLYTVSESVNALLVRNMDAQENLNAEALKSMNECTAATLSDHFKTGHTRTPEKRPYFEAVQD